MHSNRIHHYCQGPPFLRFSPTGHGPRVTILYLNHFRDKPPNINIIMVSGRPMPQVFLFCFHCMFLVLKEKKYIFWLDAVSGRGVEANFLAGRRASVSSLNGSRLNRGRRGSLNGWEEPFGLHQWIVNRSELEGQGSDCQHHLHFFY